MNSSLGMSRFFGGSDTIHQLEGSFLQFDMTSKKLVDKSSTIMVSPRQRVIGEKASKRAPWTNNTSQSKLEVGHQVSLTNIKGPTG